MDENLGLTTIPGEQAEAIQRVYREWDRAWSNDDLDAMVALYAPDATLESPLIPYLLGGTKGVLKGREEIRNLLDRAAPRKPGKRTFYRRGYFTDGRFLVWEYPGQLPMANRWTSSKSWRSRTASFKPIESIGAGAAWKC